MTDNTKVADAPQAVTNSDEGGFQAEYHQIQDAQRNDGTHGQGSVNRNQPAEAKTGDASTIKPDSYPNLPSVQIEDFSAPKDDKPRIADAGNLDGAGGNRLLREFNQLEVEATPEEDMARHRQLSLISQNLFNNITGSPGIGFEPGSGNAHDEYNQSVRQRNIEQLLQQARSVGNDPLTRPSIETVFANVNAMLREAGSPYVLMNTPTEIPSQRPGEPSEFRGYQLVDVNTGNPVERFDVMTTNRFQLLADNLQRQIETDGTFGSDDLRNVIRDNLRDIHQQYGNAGVENFLNRLSHPHLRVRPMASEQPSVDRPGNEIGGITIGPRKPDSTLPQTFGDVIWFR
jgi:hypothetical protein